jgi:hypothetical protein
MNLHADESRYDRELRIERMHYEQALLMRPFHKISYQLQIFPDYWPYDSMCSAIHLGKNSVVVGFNDSPLRTLHARYGRIPVLWNPPILLEEPPKPWKKPAKWHHPSEIFTPTEGSLQDVMARFKKGSPIIGPLEAVESLSLDGDIDFFVCGHPQPDIRKVNNLIDSTVGVGPARIGRTITITELHQGDLDQYAATRRTAKFAEEGADVKEARYVTEKTD